MMGVLVAVLQIMQKAMPAAVAASTFVNVGAMVSH